MNIEIGGIYFCKKIEEDESSGHYWLVLCVNNEKVKYMTFTSQLEPFAYKKQIIGKEIQKPKYCPSSVVFLDVKKITDDNRQNVFRKDTALNCFYPPKEMSISEFNMKIEKGILEYKKARLPDPCLVQIISCAKLTLRWSEKIFEELLDKNYGIGSKIYTFFDNLSGEKEKQNASKKK